jgi:cytochrome P450
MVDLDFESMMVNPYPYFAAMRGEARWTWSEALKAYLVSRYDDVVMIDRDDQTFSVQIPNNLMSRTIGTSMLRLDGTEHKRIRTASDEPLKRRALHRNWSTVIDDLVAQTIAPLRSRGSADLMRDFAAPLTGACLAQVLGLADASAADIERWSAAIIAGLINNTDDQDVWATAKIACDEVRGCVKSALERVRRAPDGTVVSAMANAPLDDPLDFEEIVSNVELIISGGFNDARDAIATLSWHLLTHPEARSRAMAEPVTFERAFDESVRWLSPIGSYPRLVTRDISLPGGDFKAGDRLLVIAGSANHDDTKFPDPARYDIDRANVEDHLGFSIGVHYCLGNQLVRAIARSAVPAVLALPGIRAADTPQFYGWQFRGPLSVPVTLSPSTAKGRM